MKAWKRRILVAAVLLMPLTAFATDAAVHGGCPCCPCPFCPCEPDLLGRSGEQRGTGGAAPADGEARRRRPLCVPIRLQSPLARVARICPAAASLLRFRRRRPGGAAQSVCTRS